MQDLQVEFNIAQKISRKILVDEQGRLRIFWGEEPDLVQNILPDIHAAIRQGTHIIEQYQGLADRIRGEELFLPGEKQKLTDVVTNLQGVIARFLEPREINRGEEASVRSVIEKARQEIGRVTNEFKLRASLRLERMPPLKDEKERKSTRIPVEAGKASVDLLERLNQIADKTSGVIVRTRKLIDEQLRIEKIFVTVYQRLGKFLKELQTGIDDDQRLAKIVSEISGGKANLLAGLLTIKVQPYRGRVMSPAIVRLAKLPKYLAEQKKDNIGRALEGAFKKVRPVVQEIKVRRRKKIGLTDDGQLVR